MRIGIFYGGSTGNTALIAKRLSELINSARLFPIANAVRADLEAYDLLILGTSSWHDEGDRLQSDWNDAYDCLREAQLEGKKVALYGLGDQMSYPDAFVDGMKALYDLAVAAGASIIGKWPDKNYDYTSSAAVEGDYFIGLPLDVENQEQLTEQRLATWVSQLQEEVGIT
ncbi:MAG: flavodoxin [Desulfuromonadales bacterium]|jgi:flavodoxin I|nr:flavodoxin [Desulfuromonadales bacterium]